MIKKKLLTLAVIVISIFFVSANSYSQQDQKTKKTPEEKAAKIADRMKSNLSLNDEQYRQVYDLTLNRIRDRINNKEKFKSMNKESRQNFRKQLGGILSKEQFEKMKKNKCMKKHKKKDSKKNKKEG